MQAVAARTEIIGFWLGRSGLVGIWLGSIVFVPDWFCLIGFGWVQSGLFGAGPAKSGFGQVWSGLVNCLIALH